MQDDAGVCIENIDLRHLVIEHTIAVMCLLMGRILIFMGGLSGHIYFWHSMLKVDPCFMGSREQFWDIIC